MKCGSCRNTEADNYAKIKPDDNLFKILKTLNPNRPYNARHTYFCNICITKANDQLLKITTMSDQAAKSFTVTSTVLDVSAAPNDSDSSKDEFDEIISSKREYSAKGTPLVIPPDLRRIKRPTVPIKITKPCPKRFKKSMPKITEESSIADLSSQQGATSSQSVPKTKPNTSSQLSVQEMSSELRSSESLSENDLVLNESSSRGSSVENQPPSSNLLPPSSSSLPSKVVPKPQAIIPSGSQPKGCVRKPKSQAIISSGSESDTVVSQPNKRASIPKPRANISSDSESDTVVSKPKKPGPRKKHSDVNVSSSSDKQPDRTHDSLEEDEPIQGQAVPGPSAPIDRNPRIRQGNQNLPGDLRSYFQLQNFSVNNYSRTLAG